jgi:hypothetical protein
MTRPGRDVFKVNVDFPRDMLRRIDAEALRIGIARQAWIKLRLTDLLDDLDRRAALDTSIDRTRARLDAIGTTSGKATVEQGGR